MTESKRGTHLDGNISRHDIFTPSVQQGEQVMEEDRKIVYETLAWEGDEGLRDNTLQFLSESLSLGEGLEVFEGLGTLALSGCERGAKEWLYENIIDTKCFSEMDATEMLNEALDFLERYISDLKKNPSDKDLPQQILHQGVMDALSHRDRIECIFAGAKLLGLNPSIKMASAVNIFDESIRSLIPMTTSLDRSRRSARIGWMKPEFRKRFWWWKQGE